MKHWFFVCTIAAALALAALPSSAHAGPIGLGVIAGEPTGVSVKAWVDEVHAVDGAVGWSLSGNSSLQLHADYLWHNYGLLLPRHAEGQFPVYYGIGGRLDLGHEDGAHHDEILLGVRFPVGIAWIAPAAPIDIFVEIVPVLDLLPGTELNLQAAIGVRYWFGQQRL